MTILARRVYNVHGLPKFSLLRSINLVAILCTVASRFRPLKSNKVLLLPFSVTTCNIIIYKLCIILLRASGGKRFLSLDSQII